MKQERQSLYQRIRDTTQKYARIAMLAGTLVLPGYASAEPITLPRDTNTNRTTSTSNKVYALPLMESTKIELDKHHRKEQEKLAEEKERKDLEDRNELSRIFSRYSNLVNTARYRFNESIRDGKFDVAEQREVLGDYDAALNTTSEAEKLIAGRNMTGAYPPKVENSDSNLYSSLKQNIRDYNTNAAVSLERSLNEQGLKVAVEGSPKPHSHLTTFLIPLYILLILSSIRRAYNRRRIR